MHDNTENWKGAKMKLKKTTFYSIALLLAGCVPSSLHPLYNDQTLIFVENDGTTQQLYANLITCSDEVFMAVFADVDELEPAESSAYAFHLMPDWFWRVERTDTELKLEQMDYEEVSKMLRKENSPLAAQRKNASYRFKGTRIER